jgi:chemotaxis protein methyltransferase CheR
VTDDGFEHLRRFLALRSGLWLPVEKRYLVDSRLGLLARRRGFASLEALLAALRAAPAGPLAQDVIDAMMTNETLFFRDQRPFETLRDRILPMLAASRPLSTPIRIWSAAASTGQEAYSIAMLVREAEAGLAGRRVEILGTDISTSAIARARDGRYTQFEIQRGLPVHHLLRHFGKEGEDWRISEEIRAMVTFKVANLMHDVGALGSFDVIFCRNALIYFDMATKVSVLRRIEERLAPDGALFLGAAETVIGLSDTLAPASDHAGYYLRRTVPDPRRTRRSA